MIWGKPPIEWSDEDIYQTYEGEVAKAKDRKGYYPPPSQVNQWFERRALHRLYEKTFGKPIY